VLVVGSLFFWSVVNDGSGEEGLLVAKNLVVVTMERPVLHAELSS
jgi:hypothetical protein